MKRGGCMGEGREKMCGLRKSEERRREGNEYKVGGIRVKKKKRKKKECSLGRQGSVREMEKSEDYLEN